MAQCEITNIKAISLAKVASVLGMVQGIFVIPITISLTPGGPDGGVGDLFFLLAVIVIFGIFIGLSGYITALLYNGFSSATGGLTVTVTELDR